MEFRILGPLEVVEDGRPVSLDRRRMRALLAFLLLHANELVSADRLIDEVWGPEPPKTAGASLQNYVSRLRKAIGADAVVSQAPGYVLRIDPERFDLARFERLTAEARGAEARERAEKLRAALALWRGPALDDLAFEPFARDEVGRLEEARLAALEDCIDAELEIGRDGDLVGELEELVEQHPLRERFRAQLMRALYRAGRQADALAAFQAGREVLTEELGLEPGEELRSLQRAILRQDPSLGPAGEAGTDRAADRRTVTVLVCDLVDSNELAARLDAEAYRALRSRYFELVREPVKRHGGTLERSLGDAAIAVFGLPDLHEDDALRAVRAGFEAQAALRTAEIGARVGISTGEVHVLPAPGEPLHMGAPATAAAELEARAADGEVVISDETYALVRDALRADAFENAWLVRDVVPGAPAYARSFDAPLVGRTAELDRLRAAYQDARESGECRVVTVLGEAGIGKTRLLRELVEPIRGEVRILVGRCVSYGQGATYLPIAEAVRQAVRDPSLQSVAELLEGERDREQVARRIAELSGLVEAPAAPSEEAFWAARRFLEAVARDRPVVLVLDDIHWAEPTLLDLVEYLGEWTRAPVLVLCAARHELLEDRPAWAGPTSTGFVVELEPLASDQVGQLVDGLAERPLDHEVGRRIVEQAGGNPLFAEQLLAHALEAPDLAGELPPTVEALLASRLDRLDPGELHALRRASVVGRRFTRTELSDLTPDHELRATERQLASLAERGLIHPREHVFVFHHVLVRDVAYRGIPKSERADLHELAGRGLDRRDAPDEIVGYHFEQAHRYVAELDLGGERARELTAAGGEHLGRAGIRAWQRGDVPAATNLLRRALALTPDAHDLAFELGLALNVRGEPGEALKVFSGILERGDAYHKLRAELERAFIEVLMGSDRAGALLDAAERAVPVLENSGDDRALGRAWYGVAFVRGGFYCEYAAMEEAAERIATCYGRAGWPLSTPLDALGLALEFGPKPVDQGIARLTELAAEDTGRWTNANVLVWLGRLEAMRANFEDAQALVDRARTAFEELALVDAVGDTCVRAAAALDLAAGRPALAAERFRDACAYVQQRGQTPVLATRAAELAGALYEQGSYDESDRWVRTARTSAGEDDLDAALNRQPVEAKLLARAGRLDEAERLARAVTERAAATDSPIFRAASLLALAEVLNIAGAASEAKEHVDTALALYEQKGNIAAAARVRARYEEPRAGLLVLDERSA